MAAKITPTGYGRMFNAALKSGHVTEKEISGLLDTLQDMAMGLEADSDQAEFKADSDRATRYKEMAADLYNAIEDQVGEPAPKSEK